MMQEACGDDTNGESTFEFVEGKPEESGNQAEQSAKNLDVANPVISSDSTAAHHALDYQTSPLVTTSLISPPLSSFPTYVLPSDKKQTPSDIYVPESTVPQKVAVVSTESCLASNQSPIYSVPSHLRTPSNDVLREKHGASESTVLELPAMQMSGSAQASAGAGEVPATEGGSKGGMWGWIKGTVSGNDILNKVAFSVITTVDPQMKDYIRSGGDIDIIVASDKEDKISPIREAFQSVFGRATVTGMAAQANIAIQPVGYAAGVKGAEERISFLRKSGRVHVRQPVIAVENFIAELTPERWYDVGCLLLDDPALNMPLHVYTQAVPIPIHYIHQIQSETANDYPLRWSGFSLTIGGVVSSALNVPHSEWHRHLAGVSRREMLLMAATTLATAYKQNYVAPT